MSKNNKKSFLSITDLLTEEIWQVFFMAKELKQELKSYGQNKPLLAGRQFAMLFEKPSLRTKLSFDIAINRTRFKSHLTIKTGQ